MMGETTPQPGCLNAVDLVNPGVTRFGRSNPTTAIQEMANLLLDNVPANSPSEIQIAIPVALEHNEAMNQFGDGQQNGYASFGTLQHVPFKVLLSRPATRNVSEADLTFTVSQGPLEVSILGSTQTVPVDAQGMAHLQVDLQKLGWDGMYNSKPLFFRPQGQSEWFAVSFPNPNILVEELVGGMGPSFQKLPNGLSIVDPLGLKGSKNPQNDLRQIKDENNQGFDLARASSRETPTGSYQFGGQTKQYTNTHGIYESSGVPLTQTSSGGVWTRYRVGDPFKIVYIAKDKRIPDVEEELGVVAGTGPHFIGATAEIILNNLGDDSLMTFYGIQAPTAGPDGGPMAFGLTHQWVGTWLKPGQAFVTPEGNYHWHLNHLIKDIAVQVFTPPNVPTEQNHYGFPKP